MKHYILQLDALVQVPELLSLNHNDYSLWASEYFFHGGIVDSSQTPYKTLSACLIQAETKGYVKRYTSQHPLQPNDHFSPYGGVTRYYQWNLLGYEFEEELTNRYPSDEIFIVNVGKTKGKFISAKDLLDQMKGDNAIEDINLLTLSKEIKSEKWFISISLIITIGIFFVIPALFISVLSYIKANKLLSIVVVFLILFLLRFLFRLRRTRRVQYGVIELFVGLISIGKSLSNFLSVSRPLATIDFIAILSGIYIVIRGLDNIETGLKAKNMTYYLKWWERVF